MGNIDRIDKYNKQHYDSCFIRTKKEVSKIIDEYCSNLQLSKASLIQKCVIYCYDNYIDVSNVKLPDEKDEG